MLSPRQRIAARPACAHVVAVLAVVAGLVGALVTGAAPARATTTGPDATATAAAAATTAPPSPTTAATAADLAAGPRTRVMVALKPGASAGRVVARLPRSARVVHRFASSPGLAVDADAAALAELARDPEVAAVAPDRLLAPEVTDASPHVGANVAWSSGVTGAGWTVAVLDTGVDTTRPFFAGKVGTGIDGQGDIGACFASTGCPNGQATQTGAAAGRECHVASCWHGTHVAGIAVGNGASAGVAFSGVAPDAGLYPVRVFSTYSGPTCSTYHTPSPCTLAWTSDIVAGFDHVYAQRAHYRFAAVNLSVGFGGPYAGACDASDRVTAAAVHQLAAAGIPVTVAAGNDGWTTGISDPGCLSDATAVSAVGYDGSGTDTIASFADMGPQVTLLAPGVDITSSVPAWYSPDGWAAASGTSMATPMAAGALALVRSAHPELSGPAAVQALATNGVPVTDRRVGGNLTRNRIDIAATLRALAAGPTAPAPSSPTPAPPINNADDASPVRVSGAAAAFSAIAPTRLLDTRGGPRPGAGATIDLPVTGRAGIPAGAEAVALTVTATDAAGPGYVTAWADGPRPNASSLNVEHAGDTVANLVIVPLGADGHVQLFTQAGTHLLADVAGWWAPAGGAVSAGRYVAVDPARILDTRAGLGAPADKPGAGQVVPLSVAGHGGVPVTGASAVALTLTATDASGPGFVTAWPTGQPAPLASNLNLPGAGATVPDLVIVPLGADGSVSILTSGGAHLIADVAGWFTDASGAPSSSGLLVPGDPRRVLDTRSEGGAVAAGGAVTVDVTHGGGAPSGGVGAVVANVTATEAKAAGFVTVWPAGRGRPTASNVNVTHAGQTVANLVLSATSDDGGLAAFTLQGTQLIVDVSGWFTR